jgi:uncharacterized protein YgbK (DUF1537 family)
MLGRNRSDCGRHRASSARAVTGSVAILADDLTGALDAAAPFASPAAPIEVVFGAASPSGAGSFALDSETRDVPAASAEAAVREMLPRLLVRDLPFKKIDSLMRGNTLQEIATCFLSGAFASVVVAPAFPAQGRVTRAGRQFRRSASGGFESTGPDIAEALCELNVAARKVARDERPTGAGVLVCDAEDEAGLARIAASGARLEPPVLWCGSAGLARALAPAGPQPIRVRGAPVLAIVGSRHPASLAQVAQLREIAPDLAITVRAPADPAPIEAACERLRRSRSAAMAFAMPALAPEAAGAFFRHTFARLAEAAPPGLLIVAGGSTLAGLCEALGADRLLAVGEWRPGIAVSRLGGGRWQGTTVVSKSGAFGDRDVLAELMASAEGRGG